MSPRQVTLTELAIRNAGVRKGFHALMYIAQWGIAHDADESVVTADQLAVWWKESRATSFRNQAHFRLAFPDEATPERLWELAAIEKASRARQKEVLAELSSTQWLPPSGQLF